jgi:AraC-like DNA-binding protein
MNHQFKILVRESTFEILKVDNCSHCFPMHIHRKTCVGIITAGEVLSSIDGKCALLKNNDIYLVPPFTPHTFRTLDHGRASYIVVCFNDIERVRQATKPLGTTTTRTDIEFIDRCIGHAIENKSDRGTVFDGKIRKLLLFIDDCFDRPLPLKTLSEISGLSPFYLHHIFKRQTGLSIRQYIIQTRIKKSQDFYRKRNSLLEIALQCGFYDQSHFIRHFKRHVGMTPKAFLGSMESTNLS